jgi:hypothetical protein
MNKLTWLDYIWSVTTGLIALAIAYTVLNLFSEQFERVVVALVVLLYVAVRTTDRRQALGDIGRDTLAHVRFIKLKGLVNPEREDAANDVEELEKSAEEAKSTVTG